MSVRAFVTGIGGFAGGHLAEALIRTGSRVDGTVRPGAEPSRFGHLPPSITLHPCDIRSAGGLRQAVRKARPDVVFHLAAASSVSGAETDPKGTMDVNLAGTLHLLEAIRQETPRALLIHISSAEVYGKVPPQDNPIREDRPAAPVHAYGLSKLLSEHLVRFYERCHGISSIILRPFNHIGPRQSDRFVCASFAKQVVAIERGKAAPVIRVGNLDPVRDFTDVRDMVEAYRLAAEHCRPGSLHNIASGVGISIADLLDRLLALVDARVEVSPDPGRIRPTEIPVLIGDPASFVEVTGWQRRFDLTETLTATVAYWRRMAETQRW